MASVYDFVVSDKDEESDGESEFSGFMPVSDAVGNFGFDDVFDNDENEDEGSDIDVSSVGSSDLSDNDDADIDAETTAPSWTKDNFQPFDVPYFTHACGPRFPGNFDAMTATPSQFLQLFLTEDIMKVILINTNKYADWTQQQKGIVDNLWPEKLALPELWAFIAINIVMGINPVPQYHQYWSQSPFWGNAGIKHLMSRKRYERIARYLHVNDRAREIPKGQDGFDKLAKIRPLLEHMDGVIGKYSPPSENQSIDEGMIKYKGRCGFIQYIANKPIKRGIKLFLRNDADTGYLQEFEVYLGARGTTATSIHGVYFDVINRLCRRIRNKNHKVWFDNLYTGVPTLLHLQKHGISACGTIRANRKLIPPEVKEGHPRKERGWFVCYQDVNNPPLTVCVWKDTKVVRFLSTLSNPSVSIQCHRRSGAHHLHVTQPQCAAQYNKNMAGTDKFDQKRQVYMVGRPAKKTWKYLFWFFVNSAVVNAWILFGKCSKLKRPKRYRQLDFRLELVENLTRNFSSRKKKFCTQVQPAPIRSDHANVHMGAKRPRVCRLHRKYFGCKHETTRGCKACGHHLCLQCHQRLHH